MAGINDSHAAGDFWCYNATTHACMDKFRSCHHCGQVVCEIGSTPCDGSCMPDGEGFCCGLWPGAKWYRNDEKKQCCEGLDWGYHGRDEWTCSADVTCPTDPDTMHD